MMCCFPPQAEGCWEGRGPLGWAPPPEPEPTPVLSLPRGLGGHACVSSPSFCKEIVIYFPANASRFTHMVGALKQKEEDLSSYLHVAFGCRESTQAHLQRGSRNLWGCCGLPYFPSTGRPDLKPRRRVPEVGPGRSSAQGGAEGGENARLQSFCPLPEASCLCSAI